MDVTDRIVVAGRDRCAELDEQVSLALVVCEHGCPGRERLFDHERATVPNPARDVDPGAEADVALQYGVRPAQQIARMHQAQLAIDRQILAHVRQICRLDGAHRRFAERVLRVLDDERLRLDVAGRALRRAHDGGNSWKEVAARMLAVLEPLAARRQVRTVRFDLDRVGPYRTSPTSADAAPARTVLPEELVTLGRRFRELLQLAG